MPSCPSRVSLFVSLPSVRTSGAFFLALRAVRLLEIGKFEVC